MIANALHDASKAIDRCLDSDSPYRRDERIFELLKDLQIQVDLVRIELEQTIDQAQNFA